MKKCIKCGSHAFNLYAEEIDQGGLCDVHYWQGRAHRAEAQPEQEPVVVAKVDDLERGGRIRALAMGLGLDQSLYTTPPKEQQSCDKCPWVSLTDEDRWKILYTTERDERITVMQLVEAKLKERNT